MINIKNCTSNYIKSRFILYCINSSSTISIPNKTTVFLQAYDTKQKFQYAKPTYYTKPNHIFIRKQSKHVLHGYDEPTGCPWA